METFLSYGPVVQLRSIGPGLLMTATIAAASTFISEHYGAPVMLMALLIGMAFHFQSEDEKFSPGIEFCAATLLRTGVALLGARISFAQIQSLGPLPLVLVIVCVVATIVFGLVVSKFMGRPRAFGLLTAGSVAICGASAALALSSAMPRGSIREQDTLFTVVAVTTLSTVAMIIYPVIFAALGFDERDTGFLIGATIHDVAQVAGAGYAVSETAGNVAIYTKLLRVSLLPVVIFAVSLMFLTSRDGAGGRVVMPWFVIVFAVIAAMNSAGLIPPIVQHSIQELSRWLLVFAISALGMKTSLRAMSKVGSGTLLLVVSETVFLAGLATACVMLWMR